MILTKKQIRELTDRTRYKAQCRQLEHMGIPYRKRRDGEPIVLESDLSQSTPAPVSEPTLRL